MPELYSKLSTKIKRTRKQKKQKYAFCLKDLHEDAAETIKKLFSSEDMNEKYVSLELAGIAWQQVNKVEIDLL